MYNNNVSFWPTADNLHDVAMEKRVILTNRDFVLSKSIHDVYPLPFNVFASQLEMICERGFPLLKPYNNLIIHMRDCGIIEKLYRDFSYNVTILNQIRDRYETNTEEFEVDTKIVLTLSHLDGAFTVMIFGHLISFLVFIIELIVYTYRKRCLSKRLWNVFRNVWRQVSIMRSMQNYTMNATKIKSKWNTAPREKIAKKVKFNTSNDPFKSRRTGKNALELEPKLTYKTVI